MTNQMTKHGQRVNPVRTVKQGTIYGVGLGPGAVDLMSVRADRLVRSARHVAFFRKAGKPGHARQIVADLLPDTAVEFAMEYPVTTEIPLSDPAIIRFYLPFMMIAASISAPLFRQERM